eukprot:TRINITY_DN4503_c0_g2_i1.p1 TRINITY_DN4503_c0_g2~~TRINITY_DN4503_c0_g2_i1.p1  ORF type:complete len:808 (+),score=149.13 TRINITY_DN4503_c0_g2_i1:109-2532(+)
MTKPHPGVKVIVLGKRNGAGRKDGVDSDSELDCLPDSAGKYAMQCKYIGEWRPAPKKEVAPTSSEKSNTTERKSLLRCMAATSHNPTVGGAAVRSGCKSMTIESHKRAIRDQLALAGGMKERRDYSGALRWLSSSLGLCRVARMGREYDELVGETVKEYKSIRQQLLNTQRCLTPTAKAELEKKAQHHYTHGCNARERNELQQAMVQFQEVLKIRVKLVGENHPETALARSRVATIIRDMGNLKGAMTELKHALRIQEEVLGEGHPHVAITRNNIGAVYKHQGKANEGLKEHRKALVILVLHYGDAENKFVAEVHEHLGHALQLQNDMHGAHVEYNAALRIKRKVLGLTHAKTQRIISKLKSLESSLCGPTRSMIDRMAEAADFSEWTCPTCKWKTRLDICSCCGYRRPLSKEGVAPIFAGMVIAFTGVIPKSCHASAWMEWTMAEQRGALPTEDIDESVTHLVYREGYEKSVKVQQAMQLNIKVINADWFYQSVNLGVQLDEAAFLAETSSSGKVLTKTLRHQRPAGGPRASTCPPLRCHLAPPATDAYAVPQRLPGPTPLVDQSVTPRGLAVPPASPTAHRIKVPQFDYENSALNMSCYSIGSPLGQTLGGASFITCDGGSPQNRSSPAMMGLGGFSPTPMIRTPPPIIKKCARGVVSEDRSEDSMELPTGEDDIIRAGTASENASFDVRHVNQGKDNTQPEDEEIAQATEAAEPARLQDAISAPGEAEQTDSVPEDTEIKQVMEAKDDKKESLQEEDGPQSTPGPDELLPHEIGTEQGEVNERHKEPTQPSQEGTHLESLTVEE